VIYVGYKKQLWEQIMALGREKEPRSKGITNNLDRYDVETILGTMDFFGASEYFMKQTVFDLYGPPKYRVFDWLAMNVMSRNDDDRQANNVPLKVLVHSYLKAEGDPEKFIEDLRLTDYELDLSWQDIKIDKPGQENYTKADFDPDNR
jgi:hypothetical protein